jgi:mitosis inhibitor protein kinase SWE1
VGLRKNDVDTSLTSRFGSVQKWGSGEFSEVYRVAQPISRTPGGHSVFTPGTERVWAVKKAKNPYAGPHDRKKKLREVEILQALRGHEHIVSFTDSWEHHDHLYLQTEFCENGNLKDFLEQHGNKGRLDDFRIWKILLELSQVSCEFGSFPWISS